ncbi:hypothetical protein BJ085DRAFT_14682, partial [Dimargaris cristalligena]
MPGTEVAATWAAGSTNKIQFMNHGNHKGGFCEWSISYNNGKTFVSFEFNKDCLTDASTEPANDAEFYNMNLKLPAGLPAGKAIISWTWVNREGHREFYWNCFRAQITGGTS